MKHCSYKISREQLERFLFDSEDRSESTEMARHVEACETCQNHLVTLVGDDSIEREASQLLSGYMEADNYVASNSRFTPSKSGDRDGEAELDFDRIQLDPPSHPEMLGRIGRYEIERRLGAGGMGVVFKAIDTELNRPVALKILAPHLARNGAARQRFSRESRAAAAVVHEHVVAIHNVDSNSQFPYLVMQFVSGESLQSRIQREGPLDVERILRIGIQAALGLAAAHQQGIVHRDIKPANVLLEDGVERLLITDFGLARTVDDASLTHTGVVAGTPSYMSPEQANGDEVDHRTDLFSLGSVLYFAATGHPPFRAERAMGVLHRICHERHRPAWQVNSAIPDELSAVIDRLLEKRPGKRFSSAATVAEALTRLLQQRQQRRRNQFAWLKSIGRRHRRAAWIAAMGLLVATGLLGFVNLLTYQHSPGFGTGKYNPSSVSGSYTSRTNDFETAPPTGYELSSSETSQSIADGSYEQSTLHIPSDRVEFDQSLKSIYQALNGIEKTAVADQTDSFSEFQLELRSLERQLSEIDPTGTP